MDFFHVPRERLLDCGATVYGVGGLSEENAKWEKNKKMFALFVCVCLVRYLKHVLVRKKEARARKKKKRVREWNAVAIVERRLLRLVKGGG